MKRITSRPSLVARLLPLLLLTAVASAQTPSPARVGKAPALRVGSTATESVALQVVDHDGRPAYFHVTITDADSGAVHPPQTFGGRSGPDMWFQPHIYRKTGDRLWLPAGRYSVEIGRGPEYHVATSKLEVTPGSPATIRHTLQRWVDPIARGWYAGDHHIHASGCFGGVANETSRVLPAEDLLAHVAGEGLNVADLLMWYYGWGVQAQSFSTAVDPSSTPEHLIKFGVETSGVGTIVQGHYCLLGLTQPQYPGSVGPSSWPGWNLPILRWAKGQGGVIGQAHTGQGLGTWQTVIPHRVLPPLNGAGASSLFMDITDPGNLVDFLGVADGNWAGEMNVWYHLQNCGFRIKISGESDFACIGKRVGRGRSYVKMPSGSPLQYAEWMRGIAQGRAYVSEGKGHLLDFEVDGLGVGEGGSEIRLAAPATVRVTCKAAAMLAPSPEPITWVGWSIENGRTGARQIPVEIVMNGVPVHSELITADGREVTIDQTIPIHKSSWVSVRIPHSAHANSIYVLVDDQPIRASANSARWASSLADRHWQRFSMYIPNASRVAAWVGYKDATDRYAAIVGESSIGPFANAVYFGRGCAGGNGTISIGAVGLPQLGNDTFGITLSNAAPGALPLLLGSTERAKRVVSGCELLLDARFVSFRAPTVDAQGSSALAIPVPGDPLFEGLEVHFQWLLSDPLQPITGRYLFSDGVTAHLSKALEPRSTR